MHADTQELKPPTTPLTIRVGGRLAVELARIARHEDSTITAVAKHLIAQGLRQQEQATRG